MYKDKKILEMTREQLLDGNIPIDIYATIKDVFVGMAEMILEEIKSLNGKAAVFIMPLGPVGQYKYLAKMVNEQGVSLKNLTFINMDEYMVSKDELISSADKLSFEYQMNVEFYDKIDKNLIMPETQRIFPNLKNASHITQVISNHGGVHLCVGGIGINGHVAFNEPPTKEMSDEEFCSLSTRVIEIAPETIVTNGLYEFDGAYEFMPKYAITIGFAEIMQAKKIRLYVFKPYHKMVARKASFYKKSSEFPVTLLSDCDIRIGMHESIV